MIGINSIWIFSVVLILISFLSIVLLARFFTKPFDNISFSFMRVFPCEVVDNSDKVSSIYKLSLYSFSLMCFFPIFILAQSSYDLPFLYIATGCFGLASICFVFLHFFGPTHVKAHLTLFILFSMFTLIGLLISLFGAVTLINAFKPETQAHKVSFIIKASIAFILVILELILLFNKKLRNWAKLEKVEGTGEYIRPKHFPLAYSEWGIFLLLALGELNLFAELIK